jgi:mycofactocin glycosyltransferase
VVVTPLNWDDTGSPAPVRRAPDRKTTPLPASFGLTADPGTITFQDGTVVMGGSPLRLLRLTSRAAALTRRWNGGELAGENRSEQLLARRLVSSGTFLPHPGPAAFGRHDVTVVIPVRDRPAQLEQLLSSLNGLACVVVDDASADPGRTKEIANRAGATFLGLTVNVGPAGARNAGLDTATTPLVAFVDSDCRPPENWLGPLLPYFEDPLTAAVAPRIVPAAGGPLRWLSRYESVRSSLDRGSADGLVRPMSRIPYVPSATLIIRREVATQPFFDPALRGGEDVDLVWRLNDAGWDVRYRASCAVEHHGPETPAAWLRRRMFYGTTAAPLSRRHPSALAPLNMSIWTAGVWALALRRKPVLAAATLAASVLLLGRRLDGLVDEPVKVATRIAGQGTIASGIPALGGLTRAWSPALAAGLLFRRTRRTAALAFLVPALHDCVTNRGDNGPLPYTILHAVDDLAYGTGVWAGCLKERTLRPLIPRISFRARVWSTDSLRTSLGKAAATGR